MTVFVVPAGVVNVMSVAPIFVGNASIVMVEFSMTSRYPLPKSL